MRYYFDLRDGGELIIDEEGLVLRDMRTVQNEAARALAGFAWDSVAQFNGAQSHQMAIAVRDEDGPVMEVKFSFEIVRKQ
jgi:Domain of unknown function (DUF6894)